MKNLALFLCLFLGGCGCVLRDSIPPTAGYSKSFVLYVDDECKAVLPDLRSYVQASDNCGGAVTIHQSPVAGIVMRIGDPVLTVTFTASDASGNVSNPVYIPVILLDTIKPVLILDPSLLTDNWDALDMLYDTADRLLVDLLHFDTILPANWPSVPDQIGTSYFRGINRRTYPVLNSQYGGGKWTSNWDGVAQMDSAVYKTKTLVIKVPPGHAYNGIGKRMFIFE